MASEDFDPGPLILPPEDPAEWPAWRETLRAWREEKRREIDLSSYERPEFAWMRDGAVCGMAMLFDEEFRDVDAYLERHRMEFGGLDALVLWQAYPRIGIDRRNQFDHYRLAPHLKETVDRLHARGVRVFMGYNPWDTGTRREPVPDAEAIGRVAKEFDFDGVFLDTLPGAPEDLRAALDGAKRGIVMESELALAVEGLPHHHASWAQWFEDGEAPGVLRNRWLERGHTMHLVRRWDHDHSGELHLAWMNGTGVLVWENVFGSWNGWSDRDKSILRVMSAVRRRYAEQFGRGDWEPLVPCTLEGVYASRWSYGNVTLWTLVNRKGETVQGPALPIASDGAVRLFDLIQGIELDHAHLRIPGRGIGALLALPSRLVDDEFLAFLSERRQSPLSDGGRTELLPTRLSPLPGGDAFEPVVARFRARECGEYGPAPFSSAYPALHFERRISMLASVQACDVDRAEVTNLEYRRFIISSGYRPTNQDSFLAHWIDGEPLAEDWDKPVIYVSLEDARAYARWADKRLPTEHEWQAATPTAGGVWNWTESEHSDGHTRFSILKGGSAWEAKGSPWYFDSGPQASDWAAKFIHWSPALDRCETIGFRCASDHE